MAKTIDKNKEIVEGDYIFAPDDSGRLVLGRVVTPVPKRLKASFSAKQAKNPKAKPTDADKEDDPNHHHIVVDTHRGHSVNVRAKYAFSVPLDNENETEESSESEQTVEQSTE